MPLPLWDKENFDRIAASLGRILVHSTATYTRSDLSFDVVTILTDAHKKIDGTIRLTLGEKTFLIRVSEDPFIVKWPPPSASSSDSKSASVSGETQPENSIPDVSMQDVSSNLETNKSSGIPKVSTLNEPHLHQNPSPKKSLQSPKNPHMQQQPCGSHPHNSSSPNPKNHAENQTNPSPFPPSTSTINQQPTQTPSRKRPRRFSPESSSIFLDLNTPPPPVRNVDFIDHNTAPAAIHKPSEFITRFGPQYCTRVYQPRIPPPHNPQPSATPSTLNDPSLNYQMPPPPPPPPLEDEIRDTIAIGEFVGIQLVNHENLVTEIVQQTREEKVSQ